MNKLIKLNALLRVNESNFLNLHWNASGEDFNDSHKGITTDYYELCNKYVDITAEMITRFGKNPLNFIEICKVAEKCEFVIVDSQRLYTRKEIIEFSQTMLKDIISILVECLDDIELKNTINAGIKSTLENMLEEFDLQYRYINKRRLS